MIQLQTQLSAEHFHAVCAELSERFPAIAGNIQVINAAGQFRIVAVRGGRIPDGLTNQSVEAMIVRLQSNDTSPLAHLWSDRVGAAYARRMR